MTTMGAWERYYQAVAGRAPRPLLRAALGAFAADSVASDGAQAIDLGCGDGTETHALLAQGWRVLAIDQQPAAIARVVAATPKHDRARLRAQVAAFHEVQLPAADFIYAGLSLPFCPPAHFPNVWATIVAALRPGGRFAGHFFGERDGWRADPGMTFHSTSGLRQHFAGMVIEMFGEQENDRATALGEAKHWHVYEVLARRVT